MIRRILPVLLFAWLMPATAGGQYLVWKDTAVLVNLKNPVDPGASYIKYRLTQELEYSFTFANMLFLNWQQGSNKNQVTLLQNIKYRSQVSNTRNFNINTSFVHDLGIQFFFDSITRFQPDENTLDTRIEYRILPNLTFTVFTNLATRLFNGYDYSSDQHGNLVKSLNSSLFTPLLYTFSGGFEWTIPRTGLISLGLSSGKLTVILNKEVYEKSGISEFYGVPKEKRLILEYGLSMHLLVDRDFLKRVHWNCDVMIFKNFQKPIDLVMKNLIGIRISKFFRTCLQTRLCYEKEVSKCLQVENVISLGFYFQL